MVQKETIRKMSDMNAPPTRRPADRDRAVDRIRHLTVATAVAGIIAVSGFSGLAAVTWRGAEAGVTTADVTTTTSDDTSGATSGTSAGSDDTATTSTTSSDSTTSTSTPAPTPTTPTVTSTTGAAHATSGGS